MGKARIISAAGEGLYTIEVLINRKRIDGELEWIDDHLDERIAERDEAEEMLHLRKMEVDEMSMWIHVLINRLEDASI